MSFIGGELWQTDVTTVDYKFKEGEQSTKEHVIIRPVGANERHLRRRTTHYIQGVNTALLIGGVLMPRTKGAKTRKPNAYAGRSARVRHKFGKNCYNRWGKLGGNPILLKSKRR